MKEQPKTPDSEPKRVWLKTKYANLMRYVPSENYYARFRSRGKLVWKSLETPSGLAPIWWTGGG